VVALVWLVIIAIASLLVVRLGTTALVLTGLERDTSEFQAYSAFFGVGFTTRESEHVVNHPVRRRIVQHLILAGQVGLTSVIVPLVVTFVNIKSMRGSQSGREWTKYCQIHRECPPVNALKRCPRMEGTQNLVAAARATGVRRLIAQSIAWVYAPGPLPHGEDDPLDRAEDGPQAVTARGVIALEEAVLDAAPVDGVVLRYGSFYGGGANAG
jgi:hypothetical protein